MDNRRNASGRESQKPSCGLAGWRTRVPGFLAPKGLRAFVRLHRSLVATWLLLLLGLTVQLVVVSLVWTLVDLTISLMEVWAELARKHLELTL